MTLRQIIKRARFVSGAVLLLATLLGLSDTAAKVVAMANDTAPPIGQHWAMATTETVSPGQKVWIRWHVERLRDDCVASFTTAMYDGLQRETVIDQKTNIPLNKPARPGVIDSYERGYLVPLDAQPGLAYVTSTLNASCNPVRQAIGLSVPIYYNQAQFSIAPSSP
jgi:hypothetical protein